jgi:hypothetical protein
MCSLRTVITQAAIMENIYSHVERPVILVPGAGRRAPGAGRRRRCSSLRAPR